MKIKIKKPTFRDDVRDAWKFISIRAIAVAGALQAVWPIIPEDMKATLPPHLVSYLTWALIIVSVYGILVKQNSLERKDDDTAN